MAWCALCSSGGAASVAYGEKNSINVLSEQRNQWHHVAKFSRDGDSGVNHVERRRRSERDERRKTVGGRKKATGVKINVKRA